jgi:quinol monooxygenase YgiN
MISGDNKSTFHGGFIMVKVVAKSEIKDVQIEAYNKLAAELARETRKEEGCVSYELFQDVEHHNIFTFIEAWVNQDALDRHMKSAHFQRIVPQMALLRENPSEINVYRLVL